MQTGQPSRFIRARAAAAYSKFRRNFAFLFVLFYYSTDSDSNADRNIFGSLFVLFYTPRSEGREDGERERTKPVLSLPPVFRVRVDER